MCVGVRGKGVCVCVYEVERRRRERGRGKERGRGEDVCVWWRRRRKEELERMDDDSEQLSQCLFVSEEVSNTSTSIHRYPRLVSWLEYLEISCSGKVFSVLVEGDGHHTLCCVESLFHSVTMVNVYVHI